MGLKISGLVKFTPNAGGAGDANLTISNASYSGTSFSVSNEDNDPTGIFFNSTGTRMFMIGQSSDSVYQYTLGTGFDLSTASYDSLSFSVSGQDSGPTGIFFNDSGTKMFMAGTSNSSVYQYTLGTGFDLSTASYDSVSLNVFSEDSSPQGISFNSTGTKMIMVGRSNDLAYQYTLGTGFDLSTALYDGVSFDPSSEEGNPQAVVFNSTGTRMFIEGANSATVYQYTLSTGFDLSTASYDGVSFDVSSQIIDAEGLFFNPAGTKMFVADRQNPGIIYEYNL